MGRLRASSMSSLAASSAAKAGVSKGISSGGAGYGDADVAKLKDAIQMLCQSTHPLGQYNSVYIKGCVARIDLARDFMKPDYSVFSTIVASIDAVHPPPPPIRKRATQASVLTLCTRIWP